MLHSKTIYETLTNHEQHKKSYIQLLVQAQQTIFYPLDLGPIRLNRQMRIWKMMCVLCVGWINAGLTTNSSKGMRAGPHAVCLL